MNECISRLAAEFEKMEKTIAFQSQIIKAATAQKTVCPCGFDQSAVNLPKLKLEDCSWAEIAMYAQSGMADKVFDLGDTKSFFLHDGTVLTARIIGFNHDFSNNGQINPISFECVETLNEDMSMNDEFTNKGGWKDSALRKKLNNTVFNDLPSDLQAVIKPTSKLTGTGGKEPKMGETVDKLFILSEQEIFGRKIYSMGGEGRWYDWYRQENTEYGKCKQNGERDWRWERSPFSGDAGYFCVVGSGGNANIRIANGSYGVSFGFCV